MEPEQPKLIDAEVKPKTKGRRGLSPLICKMKLENPELTNRAIAHHVQCSEANVHNVLQKFTGKYSPEQLAAYKENRGDIFAALGMRMIGSITDKQIAKVSAVQRITGAAILYDKERLERGQATSFNVTALIDIAAVLRDQH